MKKTLLNNFFTQAIFIFGITLSGNIFAQTIEQQIHQCAEVNQTSAISAASDKKTTSTSLSSPHGLGRRA